MQPSTGNDRLSIMVSEPPAAEGERCSTDRRLADSLRQALAPRMEEVLGVKAGYAYSTAQRMEQVGGDFLDLAYIDSTTATVLVGDVAGRGVNAAHVAGWLRGGIRMMAQEDRSPARVLSRVNRVLARIRTHEQLATAFLAFLDLPTFVLTMSAAGHPEPIVLSGTRASTIGGVHRSPLGAFYDTSYGEWTRRLQKGDRLVLYTDGITRAGSGNRRYGEDRLLRTISENAPAAEQDLAQAILDSATAFAGGDLDDDAVVGVIRLS